MDSRFKSFSLVDHKVAEAEFFLKRISDGIREMFAVRCYVSAFITSARSITYSMQAVMKNIDGFNEWYEAIQNNLKKEPLAQFFHKFRNINHHIGENIVSSGISGPDTPIKWFFHPTANIPVVPKEDVEEACKQYFCLLLEIVYQGYQEFGSNIDAHQYYTAENFEKIGKTIDDADEEIIGIRGWTFVSGMSEEYRWKALRDSVIGCEIKHFFEEYLFKTVPNHIA